MVENYIRKVEIIINLDCNMRCRMCDGWKLLAPKKPPALEDFKKTFINLKNWLGDSFRIDFAGGEPFLREDILDIANIAGEMGIKTSIITNGSLLSGEKIKEIINSKLDTLVLSIDSLDNSKHDYMRGVEGVSNKVISSAELLLKLSKRRVKPLSLNIASIISKYNKDDLIPLIKWVDENGFDSIIFQAINDTFFWNIPKNYDSKLWPLNKDEVNDVNAIIEEIKSVKDTNIGKRIINTKEQLSLIQDYFRRMHWMKNVR